MKNISNLKDCFGCGVCAIACPTKIITIKEVSGFYQPKIIDYDRCINCSLCLKVCAFYHDSVCNPQNKQNPKTYSAWSNDESTRKTASSGGISYEIGTYLLQKGYNICCVKYNIEQERVEHFIAESVEEFKQSIGSKYIPSFTVNGFSQLNKTDKFLVIGTPCQIDSIRRYIQTFKIEDNFILVDFFCHGIPSINMWHKYLRQIHSKIANISHVSWRDKDTGWHDSYAMKFTGKTNGQEITFRSPKSKKDLFFQMFFGHHCLSKACYKNCKYKQLSSAADIRIGDLWGTKYKNCDNGVSSIITFSSKGENIIKSINIHCQEEEPKIVLDHQLKSCVKQPQSYWWTKWALATPLNLTFIAFVARLINFCSRILNPRQ